MSPLVLDLLLASIPLIGGMALTWRLIWPWWKVPGKAAAYLVGVALLSTWIGHWSLLAAGVHQGLGIAGHLWFCKRHGFTWYAVEDPEEYVRLSKAVVGYPDGSGAAEEPGPRVQTLEGVRLPEPQTAQTEGEKAPIVWMVGEDEEA